MNYLYRMTHIDNIPHILRYGITHRLSANANAGYVEIGDVPLIGKRSERRVVTETGQEITPGNYIPFYFCVKMPMLFNIQHGFGVPKVDPEQIVYLVVDMKPIVIDTKYDICFTDGHSVSKMTRFYGRGALDKIDEILDKEVILAPDWSHDYTVREHKQAEFLVGKADIPFEHVFRIICYNEKAHQKLIDMGVKCAIQVSKKRILLTAMIVHTTGDLFASGADALVNTVNLVGVMGKGIALQFKERFRHNFEEYSKACRAGTIEIGKSLVVREYWQGKEILIINFPTKRHWRNPSEYEYISRGLDNLIDIIRENNIKSIAVPPLGAGNGGLEWWKVRAMIEEKLATVDCRILLYGPGQNAESLSKSVRLTPARALLLDMLGKVQQSGYDATLFSSVKTAYFLQRFGAGDILRLHFVPHIFGPYCDSVRHILHAMDGAYICGFADMNKRPFEPFDLIHDKTAEVSDFISNDEELAGIAARCNSFLEDYYEDFTLELLSSVDFLMMRNPDEGPDGIYDRLMEWNTRKRKIFRDKTWTLKAYDHIRAFGGMME